MAIDARPLQSREELPGKLGYYYVQGDKASIQRRIRIDGADEKLIGILKHQGEKAVIVVKRR